MLRYTLVCWTLVAVATAARYSVAQPTKPAKPTDKPAKPIDKPAKPTDKPAKPTKPADKPADKPAKPTDKRAKPIDKPAKPTKPAAKLAKPTDKLAEQADALTEDNDDDIELNLPDPDDDEPTVQTIAEPLSPTAASTSLRDHLDALPFELELHADARGGIRAVRDPIYRRTSLGEARLGIHLEKHVAPAELKLVASVDLIYDYIDGLHRPDLQTGEGSVDLRQAYFSMRPVSWLSLKIGRQIITWGTGDLLFINDAFPKDFRSFVIGRDLKYLKAPADAARADLRLGRVLLTAVYSPQLDTDRLITGKRVGFWKQVRLSDPRDPPIAPSIPDQIFSDDEWSFRAHAVLGRYEMSIYGYDGFEKSPASLDLKSKSPTFSRRWQAGASIRGPVAFGLAWLEGATIQSLADRKGTNPLVPNGEISALAGYEFALGSVVTFSAQVHGRRMRQYDAYLSSLPQSQQNRVIKKLRIQTTARIDLDWEDREWRVSLFSFFSPTERDGHVRFSAERGIGESFDAVVGLNYFYGRDPYTDFAQFSDASNAYLALRYSL